MHKVEFKLYPGELAWYINQQGKITSNIVEKVDISLGSSTYRVSAWLETAKTEVQATILYKLANTPAGYILKESSIYTSKEELLENAK